jgi:hypothetical protein
MVSTLAGVLDAKSRHSSQGPQHPCPGLSVQGQFGLFRVCCLNLFDFVFKLDYNASGSGHSHISSPATRPRECRPPNDQAGGQVLATRELLLPRVPSQVSTLVAGGRDTFLLGAFRASSVSRPGAVLGH